MRDLEDMVSITNVNSFWLTLLCIMFAKLHVSCIIVVCLYAPGPVGILRE